MIHNIFVSVVKKDFNNTAMPFKDDQMTKFENHVRKTKRKCPMCGKRRIDFGIDGLLMMRVDAWAAVKIVEPDRGYYMLFKPEIVGIF